MLLQIEFYSTLVTRRLGDLASEVCTTAPTRRRRQLSLMRYCVSPQNGQRSERAWSGLRQCQQKRGCGVSRALRRDWMSCDVVVAGAVGRRRRRAARAAAAPLARRQHVVEQVAGALVARVNVRRHRLQHDVVDRLRDLRVLEPRRRSAARRASADRDRRATACRRAATPVSIWYIVTPSE